MTEQEVSLPPQAIQFTNNVESAKAVVVWMRQYIPQVTGVLLMAPTGDVVKLEVDETLIAELIVGDYLVWDGGVIALMHEMEYNSLYAPDLIPQPETVADASEWTDPVPTEGD
jgi:hypothetical protein